MTEISILFVAFDPYRHRVSYPSLWRQWWPREQSSPRLLSESRSRRSNMTFVPLCQRRDRRKLDEQFDESGRGDETENCITGINYLFSSLCGSTSGLYQGPTQSSLRTLCLETLRRRGALARQMAKPTASTIASCADTPRNGSSHSYASSDAANSNQASHFAATGDCANNQSGTAHIGVGL